MQISKTIFLFFFLCLFKYSFPQEKNKLGYYLSNSEWTVQLGGNVVDDDGKPFKDLFNAPKSWNLPPYPTKIAVDKSLKHGWSTELAIVYNNYKNGKTINGETNKASHLFMSADLQGRYHLNDAFYLKEWFDPYLTHGFGYTFRSIAPYHHVATTNIGFGFNIDIYESFGLNIQTLAKFAIKSPFIKTGANYLQHSLGIIYKIDLIGTKKPFKFGKRRYGFATRKSKFNRER